MVSKVGIPSHDPLLVMGRVLNERSKYKEFYKKIGPDILAGIGVYIECGGNPESIEALDLRFYTDSDDEAVARKKSLINLYSPEEGRFPYDLIYRLRHENGLLLCPFCGELGRPRTLDHYLPKNKFPEFSVNLANLVPMCDWCQGEKSETYLTDEKGKKFFHPYFDDVDKPLFYLSFSPPYSSPVIDVVLEEGLTDDEIGLLLSHLAGVSFLPRYKKYFETKYISVLRNAVKVRGAGRAVREDFAYLLTVAQYDSLNSWDAILYRSILGDDRLIDYLENGDIPSNV